MMPRRGEIARYSETHDDYNEHSAEGPEQGLYPDENTDGTPAEENSLARQPSSAPDGPEDGYRMEGQDEPVESPPQVEEVGDF